jgi:hypothetical protein
VIQVWLVQDLIQGLLVHSYEYLLRARVIVKLMA